MESFKDIINDDKPVLVDFFATWCAPCKAMTPIIESLAQELKGEARILKIDIDKNQGVASHYQIQAVPTFIIFHKGEIVWRNAGAIDKASLIKQINHFKGI